MRLKQAITNLIPILWPLLWQKKKSDLFIFIVFFLSFSNLIANPLEDYYQKVLDRWKSDPPQIREDEWIEVKLSKKVKIVVPQNSYLWDIKNEEVILSDKELLMEAYSRPLGKNQLVIVDKSGEARFLALTLSIKTIEADLDLKTRPMDFRLYTQEKFFARDNAKALESFKNATLLNWQFANPKFLEPYFNKSNIWSNGIRFDNHTFFKFSNLPFFLGLTVSYDFAQSLQKNRSDFQQSGFWFGPTLSFPLDFSSESTLLALVGVQRSFFYSLTLSGEDSAVKLTGNNLFLGLIWQPQKTSSLTVSVQYQRRYYTDSSYEEIFSPYTSSRNEENLMLVGFGVSFEKLQN